ncbi:hypothetical protein JW877_01275 [bacterium]|nr:hypothetical protein [bacterium]
MLIKPKSRESVQQEIQAEYERYSELALKNMHHYATWRVYQLNHNKGVLHFLAEQGGELEDLVNYAHRIVKTENNFNRFKRRKEDLEFEMLKREMRKDDK